MAGCILVPLPEHGLMWGKGKITASDMEILREGVTTREDVLLRFGEPDASLSDGEVLAYDWAPTVGIVVAGQTAVDIPNHHSLVFEFDQRNRLARYSQREARGEGHLEGITKFYDSRGVDLNNWSVIVDPLPNIWTRRDHSVESMHPLSIMVGEFRDARAAPYSRTMIGRRWANYTIRGTEIHAYRPASEMFRACSIQYFEEYGAIIDDNPADLHVDGVVNVFKAEGITVEYDITIEVRSSAHADSLVRSYRGSSRDWRSPYNLDRTLKMALMDLQAKFASDVELKKWMERH